MSENVFVRMRKEREHTYAVFEWMKIKAWENENEYDNVRTCESVCLICV
jgi:hypothetical protein